MHINEKVDGAIILDLIAILAFQSEQTMAHVWSLHYENMFVYIIRVINMNRELIKTSQNFTGSKVKPSNL